MRYALVLASAAALGVCLPAAAQTPSARGQSRPEAFQSLLNCRNVDGEAARLACFDAAAATLEAAAQSGEVRIVDRAHVRATRRSLFGLNLPSLGGLFGGGDDSEDEVRSIESEAAEVSRSPDGRWIIRLREGGTWLQTDDQPLGRQPRAGSRIVINRAALGSYMMRIDGQPGVRARRLS